MKIQKAVLCAALIFSLEVFAKGPPPLQNFAPIVLDNLSGVANSEVYFLAHGLDPCGLPCYLVPNGMGICDYVYPNATGVPSSASPMVSKKLTDLPAADGYPNGRIVYLPINSSSRAYLSVYNPMYLPTAYNPAPTRKVLDILDASITTLRDANYYTLYQDFEFGLVSLITDYNIIPYRRTYGTQLYLNLSWVDFFALPMQLDVCTYPLGTVLNGQYTPSSGFDPATPRETIITNMVANFGTSSASNPWPDLLIPFYDNPYTSPPTPIPTYVRVLAAKNSIDLGIGSAFVGANSNIAQKFFPNDYINNTNYGSPALRRRFLDMHLAQSDPLYVHHLLRFWRAIKQRNTQLRAKSLEGIDCWEQEMALSATYLLERRNIFIRELNNLLTDSPLKKEPIEMRYQPSQAEENYLAQLSKNRKRELHLGFTLTGPHRDDFTLYLAEKPSRPYASEGQKRCASATIRLAEWQRLHKETGTTPLFGIDDFELHLDRERQDLFQNTAQSLGQIFVTTPEEPTRWKDARCFLVESGRVNQRD